MSLKSLVMAFSVLVFTLSQSAVADAASVGRSPATGATPNSNDFPSSYNGHPAQVGYLTGTIVDSGDNHMFRETIPIVCEEGKRLVGAGLRFSLVKIRDGENAGDNDTMNFWVNGQNRYEFNVGEAANAGSLSVISIDLGHLPPIGAGPTTITAVHSSLGNPISMIPDMRATQRLSFAIQDDTNIEDATVTYTCEDDPDFVPPTPIAVNSCCPPWNSTILSESLFYVGSGSINSPYTLKFAPSPGLINALRAYLNYINSTNSLLTTLNIEFQLYNQGTGNLPLGGGNNGTAVGPVSGMTLTANSTNIRLHTNYNVNTPTIFTGVSTPGTSTTPSSYPMQVGTWYLIHTGMWTDSIPFFDASICANVDVFFRVSFIKGARLTVPRAVLELANSSGAIIRTIPLGGPQPSLPIQSLASR